ncbi:PspA/IM30 family protein [Neobacillus sp. WH10]|uniref:PspA/IM30 family protein n=1 Tax=Neobacillus sp. WH10 TaxID=3047873 RepID=UPI0024C1E93C|nr:PspA/IM30 family protein [Neobacillus sp. WH10]WHY75465.1 PspA/IM30 family protein [Neobacillus sp. WH10]
MTNLFTRIKDIIIADLNETLHQKEKQNPIGKLNQYLRQCEQETAKVGKLIERQLQLKDEFAREYSLAMEVAEKRKYQAEIALKAGEEELCQFATAEHQQYSERAQRLNASLAQVSEQVSELERKHEEMKHKLKDMHLRRMELMGRENVTRAYLGMNQVLESDSYSPQSNSKFKDIENYLDRLEQKVNSSFYRSTIDAKLAQIEKEMTSQDSKSVNLIKE